MRTPAGRSRSSADQADREDAQDPRSRNRFAVSPPLRSSVGLTHGGGPSWTGVALERDAAGEVTKKQRQMPAKIGRTNPRSATRSRLLQKPDVLAGREMMKEESRDDPIGGARPQGKAERIGSEAASSVEGSMAARREVSPLQIDGDYADVESGSSDPLRQGARRHSRTGADVEQSEGGAARFPHSRNEVASERAGCSPPSVDVLEISQRPGHVVGRKRGIVEQLVGGTAGGDENGHVQDSKFKIAGRGFQSGIWNYAFDTTSALFLDPKPIVLQSACSIEAERAWLAM